MDTGHAPMFLLLYPCHSIAVTIGVILSAFVPPFHCQQVIHHRRISVSVNFYLVVADCLFGFRLSIL